jgi:hypothetical protein
MRGTATMLSSFFEYSTLDSENGSASCLSIDPYSLHLKYSLKDLPCYWSFLLLIYLLALNGGPTFLGVFYDNIYTGKIELKKKIVRLTQNPESVSCFSWMRDLGSPATSGSMAAPTPGEADFPCCCRGLAVFPYPPPPPSPKVKYTLLCGSPCYWSCHIPLPLYAQW